MRASLFIFLKRREISSLRSAPPPPRKPAASDGAAPDTLLFLREAGKDFMSLFMSLFHRMYERAKPGFYLNVSVIITE